MQYQGFTTFTTEQADGLLTVSFDFPPVNVQGQAMLADLNSLAMRLERDRDTKVVVFQSAHPEIWVCHYDTELLKDMSTEAVSREEVELLDLQAVCERMSKVPQATIAKLEGFARGGGHELALALDMRFAKFPAESIQACKRAVYESIDKPIDEALRAEAYWLYQATSKTPAIKRFTIADEQGLEHDMENQRNWNELVMKVQEIQ